MSWAGWFSGVGRKDCKTCQQAYTITPRDSEEKKELKKNGPPCKDCKPEMWPINQKVIEIYNSVSSQVLMSMSGAYAINEIAVLNRIKLEGIKRKDQKEMLDLVVMFANKAISIRNEDTRKRQDKK